MARKSQSEIALDDISPLAKSVVEHLILNKSEMKSKPRPHLNPMMAPDPVQEPTEKDKATPPGLVKSILNVLNGGSTDSIERLAFEEDPGQTNQYRSLWMAKTRLIPDSILKRIAIQDDLVAAVINARANQIGAFGRPRVNRFEVGFMIEPLPGVLDKCDAEKKKELQARIKDATEKLRNCGSNRGWSDNERCTFAQYLAMSTRNAVGVGRIATEAIHTLDAKTGKKTFHSFRPIDAGTIYRAAPLSNAAKGVRKQALHLLEQVKNKKLEPERYMKDEYSWVQVIEGRAVQAFTSEECLVHNFYPVTDVELNGYPLTPIDTMIAAVTTHINITTHNKLYFQTGRATRGMLVIKSDDVDEQVIARIRQQFNASINSVNNAWRMPVFGVGADDDITWAPIDNGGRDMEFQFLSDTNARVILSAFQMSPEELPGYAHLSRGTNSQALSESNQEYKLEAHRDVGIRPLIKSWEDFINQSLLPLIDETLSKVAHVQLLGLDAETAEKESVRFQQDMPLHMTVDEVLEKVEKKALTKKWGGDFLLNPQWQAVLDNHSGLTVGEIAANFFDRPDLAKRPDLQYVRDPLWFQWQQMLLQQQQLQQQQLQQQQLQQQAQAQQQQAQQQAQQPGGGEGGEAQPQPEGQDGAQDLTRSIDQAVALLSKSEAQLPPSKRRLLQRQRSLVDNFLKGWEKDVAEATREIVKVAEKHAPTKKE